MCSGNYDGCFMNHSFDSRDVMEFKHAPRSRFWGLKDPQDMPNNLAWGQLWSSELGCNQLTPRIL